MFWWLGGSVQQPPVQKINGAAAASAFSSTDTMMNPSRHEDRSHIQVGPKQYSSVDLISFTSNFLESNRIGSGAYADVYKGQFSDDIFRAVKKLKKMDVVEDTFAAEVRTMGNAVHHNLVKLYGYCFEDHMKALVYEYMENGSLDKILYENNHGGIEWAKLYAIAIDIANGLKYLHHDLEEPIIHHDIKAANVLLDKKFSAKIADFGLARIMNRDVSRVDLTTIRGTPGYSAPEAWIPGSQVTCKCDVFSFGMMLFEVLGKRKNGVEENWLPRIVWKQFENKNLEDFIKSCGIAKKDTKNANILCKVALWCVQDNPDLRPSMKDVVLMLEKEKLVKDPPCPFMQAFTPMVALEESRRENIDREWSDKMELDPTYPQNIIARPSYASVAGSDGEVTLPQLKSNKRKTQSPNMIAEFAVELTNHVKKGGRFSDASLALMIPKKGMTLPTESVVGESTALRKLKIIWECLMDDEISTIGVYGMGGVGKTTIMKEINNRLLKENRFDKVIWVTVSQDASTHKLQKDIAIALSSDLSNEQEPLRRSGLLLEAWERSKRIVLILDDMWQEVSLTEIGIAEPNKENGCKLVLTTRVLEVCRRMKCGKHIVKVDCLSPDEAWKLFIHKVDIELAPKVEKIAKEVAKECACLPLAIITVGGAMRGNDDISEWRFALAKLKESSNEIMDMEGNVFKCLKFSYERLPDDRLRKCFLYCALYPEDREISTSELIDFWIVEGLIITKRRNRQDELDQGQIIVNTLKNRCLLESFQVHGRRYIEMVSIVKMHDLIRDMAINITNQCFIVKSGGILEDVSDVEEWGDILERASYMKNDIKELSISPKCPQLSTLFLAENPSLHKITDDFFVFMKGLRVLDLRENEKIKSLPTSISDLVNLRALLLSRCQRLSSVPSLAKLLFLRILDLNDTAMEELPQGIEKLDKLTCLNLSATSFRETIPAGIISKLSSLQKLDLSFIDEDKLYSSGNEFQFIEELLCLKELEDLIIVFRSLSDCASYVGSSKFNGLKDFCFVAGYAGGHDFNYPRRTVLMSYPCDNPQSAHFLPPNTESFRFKGFNDFKRLYELDCLHDVTHLRECEISECASMECILSSEDENQATLLQRLEKILIEQCPNFFTLYKGIPNLGILPRLRNLTVYSCHKLKNLFSSSQLLQSFLSLEEISVGWCDEMEELIGDEMGEGSSSSNNTISLPRLKKLSLRNLYKLERIWKGDMACNSLQEFNVRRCYKVKKFINVAAPSKP